MSGVEVVETDLVGKYESWSAGVRLYRVMRRTPARVYIERLPGMDYGYSHRSAYIQAHEAVPVRDMDHFAVIVAARKVLHDDLRNIKDTAKDKSNKALARYEEKIK